MKKVIIILLIFSIKISNAQVKKFGKSIKQDFAIDDASKYPEADAVVLFKERKTHYEYTGNGMRMYDVIHERIKILNKEGYEHATKKISLYIDKTDEYVKIKAVTYNLKDGKVIKTKLTKKDIFEEKINKFWKEKKFTMPNLSEGCIVEWEYKLRSPYVYAVSDFIFQYDIPIKYFKGHISFPEEFSANYEYSSRFNLVFAKEKGLKVTIRDVEALKEEPYVNNIENYRGKVSFEISKASYLVGDSRGNTSRKTEKLSGSWDEVAKSLYKERKFGQEFKKTKYFTKDLEEIIKKSETRNQKIKNIFEFVKNKIKWNKNNGVYTRNGVKKAYNTGIGNVAEINLVLTAMLQESGLDASPILVSTISHGIPVFPTRNGFNYVIAGIELRDKIILLDATEQYAAVNVLPRRVLNWKGRIIRKQGTSSFIDLVPKAYTTDVKKMNIEISADGSIKGNLKSRYKNLNALTLRNKYIDLSEESLLQKLEEKYKNIEISNIKLENEIELKKPFVVTSEFTSTSYTEIINDKIYFSPLFFLNETENPFLSKERNFAVDFGTPWSEDYDITIKIPEGYKVEKLPARVNIKTESDMGDFYHKIMVSGDKILLKVGTKMNNATIDNHFYSELRKFYTARILKQNEKVVLVKE